MLSSLQDEAAGEVGPGGEVCDNPDLCSQLLTLLVSRLISMTYWLRVMETMGLAERFVTTLNWCFQLLTSLFPG